MNKNKLKEVLKKLDKEKLEEIIFKNYEYIVDEYERYQRDVQDFEEVKMDICLNVAKEDMENFGRMLKHLDNLISKE